MWDLLESIGFWLSPKTRLTGLRRTLPLLLITAFLLFGAVGVAFATPDVPVRDESGDPVGAVPRHLKTLKALFAA